MEKILIIEDDPDIAKLLEYHLNDLGFAVDHAANGNDGLKKALEDSYTLLILDIMLPGLEGKEICKRLRAEKKNILILMLSAKSELIDRVLGLELGADDYLTKPFSIQEAVARVKALLRRQQPAAAQPPGEENVVVSIGDLSIDSYRRKVTRAGEEVVLTPKQFDLLTFLAQSPGRPYSRAELLAYIWSYESSGYEHTVDTHINRLRTKVEPDPSNPTYILTVWGVGYRFVEPGELKKPGQ